MLNDISSPLALLETRRSGRPRDLVAPGPDAGQLDRIVRIAARTPDHGKLAPWRFVHVPSSARGAYAALLHRAYRQQAAEPGRLEIEAIDRLAHQAPTLVVALFSPKSDTRIPLWEQQLSCGAACMNFLHGAHALGFAGGWITGWPCSAPAVREAFAEGPDESIAGFLYVGTPALPLDERPRPGLDTVFSRWSGA